MKNQPVTKRDLKIVTWKEVRNEVIKANKELAEIIDAINPSSNYKFVKATYLYGDLILKDGIAQLPIKNGDLQPLNSTNIPNNIKELLGYQAIPLFLASKNDTEVFVDTGSRAIPLNLLKQGSLLGSFESVDNLMDIKANPRWSVSAGVRTIIMLPKITDNNGLKNLRTAYNIPSVIRLNRLQDHWAFFAAIASSPNFNQSWYCEILFFTKNWLNKKNDSNAWHNFRYYLFKQGWNQAHSSMERIEHYFIWEIVAKAISLKNLKPRPYLADHVKHILSIALGKSPAFRIDNNLQTVAPSKGLKEAFLNVYQLKNYLPTIMYSCSLDDIINGLSVYYSLSFPTILEGSILKVTSATLFSNLRDIKLLLDTIQEYIQISKKYSDISSILSNILKNLTLDYFHTDKNKKEGIEPSLNISEKDPSLLIDQKKYPDRVFCDSSLFWRASIKIQNTFKD